MYTLSKDVLLINQVLDMTLFQKCPICGCFAFVKPELADSKNRVFKCGNGHIIKTKIHNKSNIDDKEIMEHLPEWVRILDEMTKHKKIGS